MGFLRALGLQRPPLLDEDLDLHAFFKTEGRLGEGGSSTVYKVRRLSDGQHYALKLTDITALSPKSQQAILDEVRLLSSLSHPNLVKYYEAFVDHRRLCVVMELVSGGDMAQVLKARSDHGDPLSEREVWGFLLQAALALQYLHKHHVLHRDLKPENLLVGGDGILRMCDLGVSREMSTVFTTDKNGGSAPYQSPEMHLGQPYSYSADVWALGCIAHEMCSLQRLFFNDQAQTLEEIRRLVLSGRVPVLPGRYSAPLRQLVSQMLHPDPARRPTLDEVLTMPAVQAKAVCLPAPLRSALAELDATGLASLMPKQRLGERITLPSPASDGSCSLDLLNAVLPPAQYAVGTGVAQALAERLQSSSSRQGEGDGCASDALQQQHRHSHLKRNSAAQRLLQAQPLQVNQLQELQQQQRQRLGGQPGLSSMDAAAGAGGVDGSRSSRARRMSLDIRPETVPRRKSITVAELALHRHITEEWRRESDYLRKRRVPDMLFDPAGAVPFEFCRGTNLEAVAEVPNIQPPAELAVEGQADASKAAAAKGDARSAAGPTPVSAAGSEAGSEVGKQGKSGLARLWAW